ncbi:embryonic polarity protein dorsal-like isoform X1 [Dermacentor andersoni]|uniref:embryonic polarity protein dorsal-like isoform X1 n=2 Tax=Dermacentor andersoni TaxID=34620 RepID=UPI002155B334|nr:embryonic polarity protein dorsal-like isoform X1 [Dermacentor andersoni]
MQTDVSLDDVAEVIERHMAAEPTYLSLDQQARLPVAQPQPQQQPHVVILEQPASRALRFRYQCEGRYPGTLVGVSSTAENKTYPTIKVMGIQKPAVVVVSCVTKDQPYRVHPHNLVGKEGCKNGICTQHLKPDMTCTFTSLGIQCVKRRDVEQNLVQRENIRVDPFRNGFAHKDQAASIDLNAVRLCFQVFLEGSQPGKFTVPLHPVVSDIIYDRKAMSDLTITKLSHTCAPMSGGLEMILLCDKVAKDDIEVWFEEERDGQTVWKERAELLPNGVHKQVAICFRTPRYRDPIMADVPVDVHLLLRRPSDGALSEARAFTLHPNERDPEAIERKKRKIGEGYFDRYFQESVLLGASAAPVMSVPRTMRQAVRTQARPESGRSPVPEAMVAATAMQQQQHPMMQQAGATTMTQLTPVNPQYRGEVGAVAPPAFEPEVVETAEKLDSLDLGIDPNDIALTSGDLNMNLSDLASAPNLSLVNLSASLFDSGNNIASESNLMDDGRGLLNDLGGSRVFKTEPS